MRVLMSALIVLAMALTASAQTAGQGDWCPLFNGKDFTGWQDAAGKTPNPGWIVENGEMVCTKGGIGYVWTKQRFGDFVLDLEFKTEGNSGIFFRTDKPRDCVQTGIEIQVDNPSKTPNKHTVGAIYDLVAPTKDVAKAGDWNHVTITACKNKITVVMNGQQIAEMDLDRWTEAGKNPDGTPNKFRTALKDFKREGHIGFQDHGHKVAYRNVRIKTLDK